MSRVNTGTARRLLEGLKAEEIDSYPRWEYYITDADGEGREGREGPYEFDPNGEDEDLVGELEQLNVGDSHYTGGGSGPTFEYKRIA